MRGFRGGDLFRWFAKQVYKESLATLDPGAKRGWVVSAMTPYPLYRGLGRPQGPKIILPIEHKLRTVQPVASRYTTALSWSPGFTDK